MKVLLTRTVPADNFYKIRTYLKNNNSEYEIYSLIQESFNDAQERSYLLKFIVKDGPFTRDSVSSDVWREIKEVQLEKLIITANNGTLSGYEEFIEFARKLGMKSVVFVTRHLNFKEISIKEYNKSQQKINGKGLRFFIKDSLVICCIWVLQNLVKLFIGVFLKKNRNIKS